MPKIMMRTAKRITGIILLIISVTYSMQGQLNLQDQSLPCIRKDFPVMIHVSVDSTSGQSYLSGDEINTLMSEVSRFFRPICMSFSACEVNVIENYSFHRLTDASRLRELRVVHGKERRINIFIVGSIPNVDCGTSVYYGINEDHGEFIYVETDGCNDGLAGQIAHHLGHYFGLADTYRGSEIEIVNDQNCAIKADSICDTPTDPFGIYQDIPGEYLEADAGDVEMEDFVIDCEFVLDNRDPNEEYYQPQVGNAMSAYPCRCGFTNGQYEKIVENYLKSNNKPY